MKKLSFHFPIPQSKFKDCELPHMSGISFPRFIQSQKVCGLVENLKRILGAERVREYRPISITKN